MTEYMFPYFEKTYNSCVLSYQTKKEHDLVSLFITMLPSVNTTRSMQQQGDSLTERQCLNIKCLNEKHMYEHILLHLLALIKSKQELTC